MEIGDPLFILLLSFEMSRDFPIYQFCPLPDVSGSKEMHQWSERDLTNSPTKRKSCPQLARGVKLFKSAGEIIINSFAYNTGILDLFNFFIHRQVLPLHDLRERYHKQGTY